jgi:hypothetical protein
MRYPNETIIKGNVMVMMMMIDDDVDVDVDVDVDDDDDDEDVERIEFNSAFFSALET